MQVTTYQTQSSFADILSGEPLSEGTLAYFRERQRNRIHELVISEFLKSGISKADFARRIRRDPAQITRWLASPGNWELDTISDFLIGISGGEFDPQISYPAREEIQPEAGPAWLSRTQPSELQFDEASVSNPMLQIGERLAFANAFLAPEQKLTRVAEFAPVNDNFPLSSRPRDADIGQGIIRIAL
jgi:hypothetical protein